jgi:hypothetical protein
MEQKATWQELITFSVGVREFESSTPHIRTWQEQLFFAHQP